MEFTIRKAVNADIDFINEIYENVHLAHEKGLLYTGWVRGVYPTKKTAEDALLRKDLFVGIHEGKIVGTAIINKSQHDIYKKASWQYDFPDGEIMVLHTLVIDPNVKGKGFGSEFVKYYEEYAKKNGCRCLRIDTNELNNNARKFYKKAGYTERGIFPYVFNGIEGVKLVMLEKKID